ncbi:hypothetical protein [Kitasatospora sp. NPDC094015]|uniref:hypothetical protein n=1 Tax=Kitasatospora sp. NPDC094015 TaxID=3155205 RepID=UPI003330BA16
MDVEFFIEHDGSGRRFEPVVGACFEPDDAVLLWESRLTGVTVEELRRRGEPRTLAPMADGYLGFVFSARLCVALAAADQDRLDEVAEEWAEQEAGLGDPDAISARTAVEILRGVAALARRRRWVYCRCW